MTNENSVFNQTDANTSYNLAETGMYLQSLTQIPRNQAFSAEGNSSKRNYVRKTNRGVFQQIKGMTANHSIINSPVQSRTTNPLSTEGTLDQVMDSKGLVVTGSDIMMNAETRDISKKLKNSFSN